MYNNYEVTGNRFKRVLIQKFTQVTAKNKIDTPSTQKNTTARHLGSRMAFFLTPGEMFDKRVSRVIFIAILK